MKRKNRFRDLRVELWLCYVCLGGFCSAGAGRCGGTALAFVSEAVQTDNKPPNQARSDHDCIREWIQLDLWSSGFVVAVGVCLGRLWAALLGWGGAA